MNGPAGRRALGLSAAAGTLAAVLGMGSVEESKEAQRLAEGRWGGVHIAIEVTGSGARLEFDCAHGTIDEPLGVDASGLFRWTGTYVREGPGPAREGDSAGRRATYTGKVDGQSMTLTVTIPDSGQDMGTFMLELGRAPRIRKCG